MIEIWKDIIGFEGIYQFSNLYRIKRLFNRHGNISNKILKIQIGGEYPHIGLRKNNKYHTLKIHHLVLEYFVGPCPVGMECRHLNSINTDYKIENLRWDTHKNNMKDSIERGTFHIPNNAGSERINAKLNKWKVRIIKRLIEDGYLTFKEIAKLFNVSYTMIWLIANNKRFKYTVNGDCN
jgi:hypothetical protein